MSIKQAGWLHFQHQSTGERLSAPAFVELFERETAWGDKARFVLRFKHPAADLSLSWDELRAYSLLGQHGLSMDTSVVWKPTVFILKNKGLREAVASRVGELNAQSLAGPLPDSPEKLARRVRLDDWNPGWASDLAWDPLLGLGSSAQALSVLCEQPRFRSDSDSDLSAWMEQPVSAFGAKPPRSISRSNTGQEASKATEAPPSSTPSFEAPVVSGPAQTDSPAIATSTVSSPALTLTPDALEQRAQPSLSDGLHSSDAELPIASHSVSDPISAPVEPLQAQIVEDAAKSAQQPHQASTTPTLSTGSVPPSTPIRPRYRDNSSFSREREAASFSRPSAPAPTPAVPALADGMDELEAASGSVASPTLSTVRFVTARFPNPSSNALPVHHTIGEGALFACQTFLPAPSFEAAKPFWMGAAERSRSETSPGKEPKKDTLFSLRALDALRAAGHSIVLDGQAWGAEHNYARELALTVWAQSSEPAAQAVVARSKLSQHEAAAEALLRQASLLSEKDVKALGFSRPMAGLLGQTGRPATQNDQWGFDANTSIAVHSQWEERSHEDFSLSATFYRLPVTSELNALASAWAHDVKASKVESSSWTHGYEESTAKLNAERPRTSVPGIARRPRP